MLGQLADVGPRNKRLLAGPGKDDDANRLVILNVMKRRPQLLHGRHVERIEHLRPVDGDVSNRVFLFEKYVFEVHKSSLPWRHGVTEKREFKSFLCASVSPW